jgi:hypothetical protein
MERGRAHGSAGTRCLNCGGTIQEGCGDSCRLIGDCAEHQAETRGEGDHAEEDEPPLDTLALTVEDRASESPWRIPDPISVTRAAILTRMLDTARVITSHSDKVRALVSIARAVAATDPDRAAQLTAEAEHTALFITDESFKASALANIAAVVAATDPDRAERIAQSIASKEHNVCALASIAAAVRATDPNRAAQLTAEAEHTALSITGKSTWYLASIAAAVAATDPDRAERIALSITEESTWNLASIAKVVAATDPDRAERIALSITDEHWKARALASIAAAVAATDPDRAAQLIAEAERTARSIDRGSRRVWPLTLTRDARDNRRDEVAYEHSGKAWALAIIAEAIAATDRDRAARLAAEAERTARSITSKYWKARAVAHIAEAVAAVDPDRAERIALSITDDNEKISALAARARAMATTDPDRAARLAAEAERTARSIHGDSVRASALAAIAWALT